MRLLLWVAVIVVVLLWLQHAKKTRIASKSPQRPPAAAGREGEAMVRCAHCGVHVPVSEALGDPAGIAFCSEEHRARHRA